MESGGVLRKLIELGVFVGAALLEVGGDAMIRAGLRGRGAVLVAAGFMVLGTYGILVNQLTIDFSRLLGAYVGIFALASVLFGRVLFKETIAGTTWIGLCIVLVGSLVIHYGR
jgi:small multidrug resistance family-3 protein